MEELRQLLEGMLHEWQRDLESSVDSWSAIEGEPATYGVEFATGEMFFISVTEA